MWSNREGSVEIYADIKGRALTITHMKGKAQEGESIEPSEVVDNKNNSVKEKNIMFGARK